jgi:hypothetical protein
MIKWVYDITRHDQGEILRAMEARGFAEDNPESRVLFCVEKGGCYFDEAPDPYLESIKDILNERGQSGWELVELIFRQREMLCVWRKPIE